MPSVLKNCQVIAPGLYMQRCNIREVSHEADETSGTEVYTMQLIEEGVL